MPHVVHPIVVRGTQLHPKHGLERIVGKKSFHDSQHQAYLNWRIIQIAKNTRHLLVNLEKSGSAGQFSSLTKL